MTTNADPLTVGAVARMVGVSVRTLHHWDEIGLVRPSGRTWSDYRVYDAVDVARIHRVLVYREVGIPLAQIGPLLDDPDVDEGAHLRRQRELLTGRIARLQEMVSAVEHMMEATMTDKTLTPEEMSEIFGSDWNPDYQDEAEQRWGDTPQWEQSQARQQGMTREDWEAVKAESDALDADMAAAVRDGAAPGSETANALTERHRASIARWYDCSHAMQVCLGRMYLEDQRFTDRYEAVQPGLAQWLHDAIAENARAHGIDPETATWE
ncbi:MAG: MerR family transcriptional regulator [Mobilicoccus sp.]|nr:MerR family transcriptional regulator [Mobilicoccus sp.]